MKRSKKVALWLTGTLAVSGCHRQPDGAWAWGPATSGTSNYHGGYSGSYGWHWSGGGWGGEEGGIGRGGFGSHGGFGGGE